MSEQAFCSRGAGGDDMLFALVLGTMLGMAAMTLWRQWTASAFDRADRSRVLTPAAFPHLAPPTRPLTYRRHAA